MTSSVTARPASASAQVLGSGTAVTPARTATANNALVLGPEEFGWSGYFNSGYDLWYGDNFGWGTMPDRTANGGIEQFIVR